MMNEKEQKKVKNNQTCALLLKGDLDAFEQLKEDALTLGLYIIYQKTSPGRLYVSEVQPC